ncbi:raffinose/stachyose/melibiose transport system substrate-binding protein [Motilibacter peucedani]|uniref:Raffinose/stachyose/melibiose transport system substrate-binding protein n=1 Tax=Motilibacter peucedani TaxID=598650 RepID=A0A420XRD5_9ACTN|nr:ABC transporter substrate-binding protein [Motilibacter peucedani]RKS77466.1 raffinose/stachyose/melibiose transport system substrate-binding protein [Motilibacter peucedani]
MNLFATSKPRALALATACLVALPLAACGGGSGSSGSSGGGSATKGTVSWWGWTPTDAATAKNYIAEFNKKYPDIKVNFKLVSIKDWTAALRPALASSSGPDVFDMQPGAYVAQFKSFAEDLTPVVEKALGEDWQSKVAPIGVSGLTADGKLTALSVGSTFAGTLWINKGLFDKYGVQPPTTLAEWVAACKTFQAAKQGCFVQGASQQGFDQDTLQAIANSVQPGLWTKASKGEVKWDDPGIVKTWEIWKQLFDQKIMQEGAIGYQQYPDANNDFLTGKYAMVMMGTWYTQYATEKGMTTALSSAGVSGAKPFPIVPIRFPDVAGSGNTSEMFGDSDFGLAVAKKSKNKAAAETFATWLATSPEGQQVVADQLDTFPALKSAQPNFDTIKLVDPAVQTTPVQDLVKSVGSVSEPRFALLGADIQAAMLAAATSVASGKASPEEAAKTMQAAAVAAGLTFK